MDHIDESLSTDSLDVNYKPCICAAATLGKKTLNHYYNKTDHTEVYCIAMGAYYFVLLWYQWLTISLNLVLHPAHKLAYFEAADWEPEWIDMAKTIICEEFKRTYTHWDVDKEELNTAEGNVH